MRDRWLYSIEPELSGAENMRRDEAMAIATAHDGIPRIRLYSWRPWTLSLGHNQPIDEAAISRVAERGYELVRRPTGGRAVLHADELTYAVTMRADGAGVHEMYARINAGLKLGLEQLGAAGIEFTRSQPDFRAHYAKEDSANCFSASALSELTWNGRKLVGSAQRRYGPILLQHGSLLFGDAHLEIIDILSAADGERRSALRSRLAERTATLRQILDDRLPSFDRIAEELARGIAATFDGDLIRGDGITPPLDTHEPEGIDSWPTSRG